MIIFLIFPFSNLSFVQILVSLKQNMETWVALLRAVNVAGKNMLPMAAFRTHLEEQLNFCDVVTYLQTGNAIFKCVEKDHKILEKSISDLIKREFKYDVVVIVREASYFEGIIEAKNNPLSEKNEKHLYVIFFTKGLGSFLDAAALGGKNDGASNFEISNVFDDAIYICAANGYSKSKFNAGFFEKKIGQQCTARNWATIQKIVTLTKQARGDTLPKKRNFDETELDVKEGAERKVIVYIACSVDGYIAGPNGDISFLDIVNNESDKNDYGYNDFVKNIKTVIMGRKSYEKVKTLVKNNEFPHMPPERECYVITGNPEAHEKAKRDGAISELDYFDDRVKFYNGDLNKLIDSLEGNVYIDGGSSLIYSLRKLKLIDEYIINYIPVILGCEPQHDSKGNLITTGGTKLFLGNMDNEKLTLLSSQAFPSGLLQVHYKTAYAKTN